MTLIRGLLFASCLTFSGLSVASDYYLDDFKFEWKLLEVGEVEYAVIIEDDSEYFTLESDMYRLRLTERDVLELVDALKEADRIFKDQQNAIEDMSEDIVLSDYRVTFRTTVKWGFSIIVSPKKGYGISRVLLDRKTVKALVRAMPNAKGQMEFAKSKLNLD